MACAAAGVGRHNLRNLNHDEGFDRSGHGRGHGRGDPAGSSQAGGNGGAVAAGVIGGLAVGGLLGAAAAQPRYYAPAPVYAAPPPPPATGPAASRSGTAIAAPGCGRASRSATKSATKPRCLSEFATPARLARAFLFEPERCCTPRHSPYSPREFRPTDPIMPKGDIKKVVLAYSGGLDTSIILKWLQTTYGCEVVTFTADLGQGEELAPAREKAILARHQAGEHLHRGSARGVRPRLRVPDVPRQCAVRGHLSARHLDRAAADRQEADRDRAQGRRRRGLSWRDRQGQRPGPLRADLLRARSVDQDHRAVARMDLQGPRGSARVRARAPDPDRQGQGGRGAVLGRRQPVALVVRGQGAGGPVEGSAAGRLSAHHLADGRARQGDRSPHRLRQGRPRQPRRQEAVAGRDPHRAQRARQGQRHRPHRSGREPLRRHEVARRLRDAGRHDPAGGAPRDRVDHARPRRGASQGRADAALRRADLQRLLVHAGARDAAGADRQEPGARRGRGAAQALQGQRADGRPRKPRSRSIPRRWSPSRTTRAPTTRRTPRASSGSTRCGCARSACAGRNSTSKRAAFRCAIVRCPEGQATPCGI